MLSISLLGSPQVRTNGTPLKITRRKSRALLFYLAVKPQPVPREELLALLWPDLERTAGLQTLRTSLYDLRKQLGEALMIDEDTLRVSPDVEVDARTFESALKSPAPDAQMLTEALQAYRGEFLANFYLPEALEFENWLSVEREHYRRLALRGYAQLSRLRSESGEYQEALFALEQALVLDPLQEDLQREKLRVLYLAGDRPGAIRHYDQLRKMLDEELGVPPMVETRQLYQAILTDDLPDDNRDRLAPGKSLQQPGTISSTFQRLHAAPEQEAGARQFVGREKELQVLQASVSSGKLLLIEGEPGIGKTSLAHQFLSGAGRMQLEGAARELDRTIPYQPLIEAVRSLLVEPAWPALQEQLRARLPQVWQAEAARLLPEIGFATASGQPRAAEEWRLWEGFHQLLQALARIQPVILFLDDLQWIDVASLSALDYLLRQQTSGSISFLAATRRVSPRSPESTFLQGLQRSERLVRISLRRLDLEEISILARQAAPTYAFPLAEWLNRNSEGVPLVIVELLQYARENNLLTSRGAVDLSALSGSPAVPPTVYSLIRNRLGRISEPARRILDAAVAFGREFEFDIVARAAVLSEDAALDALDELRSSGLIHPAGATRFAFGHNLTMEVAYQEVGEPRHLLLHRRVAEAMESLYEPARLEESAGIVAFHFFEAGSPQRAAPYARQAGDRARRLAAWREAADFYTQALAGTPMSGQAAAWLSIGEMRQQAGDYSQAAEAFQRAAEHATALHKPELVESARLALAQSMVSQTRFEEAISLATKVLEAAGEAGSLRAEMIWGTALSLEGSDLEDAARHLERAAAYCPAKGKSGSLAQIKFELGSISAQQGDLPRAVSLYQEALAYAEQDGTEQGLTYQILARNNLAYHLLLLEDPQAEGYAQDGMALAREKGVIGILPYLLSTWGEILLSRNEVDAAQAAFQEGLALAEQLPIPERVAGLTANLGLVARQRDQKSLAIHHLSTALAEADSLSTHHLAIQIRLWLAPLLPRAEGRAVLRKARALAEIGGRRRLLEQVETLEGEILS